MSKTSHLKFSQKLVCVTTQPTQDPQTGKIGVSTFLQLPEGTNLNAGSTYEMAMTPDGTITLSPMGNSDQLIDDQRQQELLDAMEQTHQQFGNALRRLAQ